MIDRGMDLWNSWLFHDRDRTIFDESPSMILIHKDNILGLVRPNFSSKKDSFDERPLSPGLTYDYDNSKTFSQIEIKKVIDIVDIGIISNWRCRKWMANFI